MKLPEAGKKIESIIVYGKKLETHMGKARRGVWSENNWDAGGRDLKSSWSIPICGRKSVRKNGVKKVGDKKNTLVALVGLFNGQKSLFG